MKDYRSAVLALLLSVGVGSSLIAEEMVVTSTSAIKVEIRIGTDVKDREVVQETDLISINDQKIVGWTLVTGAKSPIVIKHRWLADGVVLGEVELPVKSEAYRTWSRKSIYGKSGNWRLEVIDENGQLLGSKDFKVLN